MDEEGNFLTVKCDYDFMGRRVFKKVISGNSTVISHQRFIYRGYLQIACVDLTRTNHPCLWLITWEPTQPIATRPLAIQKDGTWYTYGLDLTKNVCEVFGATGYIRTAYTYSPYGSVTATGNVTQPIQWSSEFYDEELGLVYYNYRYYNTLCGVWNGRDSILYANPYNMQNVIYVIDKLGLAPDINLHGFIEFIKVKGRYISYYEFMENYINEPEYFVITGHGCSDGIYDDKAYVIPPQELAAMIIKEGYKFDKPIQIYACHVGDNTSPTGYLSLLANELSKNKPCNYQGDVYIEAPIGLWHVAYDEKTGKILQYTTNCEIKSKCQFSYNEDNELVLIREDEYISKKHKVYIP